MHTKPCRVRIPSAGTCAEVFPFPAVLRTALGAGTAALREAVATLGMINTRAVEKIDNNRYERCKTCRSVLGIHRIKRVTRTYLYLASHGMSERYTHTGLSPAFHAGSIVEAG